jgi:hypothetical protein
MGTVYLDDNFPHQTSLFQPQTMDGAPPAKTLRGPQGLITWLSVGKPRVHAEPVL